MKLSGLQSGIVSDFAVTRESGSGLDAVDLLRPVSIQSAMGEAVSLVVNDQRILLRLGNAPTAESLARLVREKSSIFCLVSNEGPIGVLRSWTFQSGKDLRGAGDLAISIGPNVLDSLARLGGDPMNDADIQEWFREEFVIEGFSDAVPRLVIRTEISSDLFGRSFVVEGSTRELHVLPVDGAMVAQRLAPRRNESTLFSILLTIHLRFVTGLAEPGGDGISFESLLGNNRYLDKWDRYAQAELEAEEKEAENFGKATFSKIEELSEGTWRFTLMRSNENDLLLKEISIGATVDAAEETPNSGHSVNRFLGDVANKDGQLRFIEVRPLDAEMRPPPSGTISYSLRGISKSRLRRQEAYEKFLAGKVPLRQLRGILEMTSSKPGVIRPPVSWDSPAVRAVFAESEPTSSQKRAIEVALNTPDIVVIQGPPGTGKTQVIAAIAARVAEEGGLSGVRHRVLLSSFQNDAVNNVAARTVVFGLPTTIESSRRSDGTWYSAWRKNLLQRSNEMYGQIPQGELAQLRSSIIARRDSYKLAPGGDQSSVDMLEDFRKDLENKVSQRLLERLSNKANSLKTARLIPEKESNLIAAIRSLRTTHIGHADDGSDNANRVIVRLKRVLADLPDDINLSALVDSANSDVLPDSSLSELELVKSQLLDLLIRRRVQPFLPSVDDNVLQLINDVVAETKESLEVSGQGISAVLERFIHDLESDRDAVKNALAEYAAVVAATCQSAGSLAVPVDAVQSGNYFDTVIIDEAARANPLDLLIPMSLASNRVVLVGDQRQLPHIVDNDIASSIISSELEFAELEESLFGRLFDYLEAEHRKGRPRRTVTLSAQFRMHSTLGNFVSRAFYEPDVTIESPRPDADFAHTLPGYENMVAAWIDVPAQSNNRGDAARAERVGTSWQRLAEAKIIAEETKRLLEVAPELTIGVITFYRAQTSLILEQLVNLGVADFDMTTGEVVISSDYWRFTKDAKGNFLERLKVGTVDAFQGQEFDVVLLSLVRTPTIGTKAESAFGHLRVMNRLCVAMSRQRRLLIAVGDRLGLTGHPAAESQIAPICALSRLCDEEVS